MLKEFIKTMQKCGILIEKGTLPHLCVELNKIILSQKIPGLKISYRTFQERVKIKIVVEKENSIEKPIFLCFGILKKEGRQMILPEIILKEGSRAKILGFCAFPQAENVFHKMKAEIKLKKGAELFYQERHYHGENFGTQVCSNFKVSIDPEATFKNEFVLDKGSVGKLKIFLEAKLKENAFCQILNRVIGKGKKDEIEIYDKILLNGENSRSLNKIRGVVIGGGKMFFKGQTDAGRKAKGARGHIDCQEIVVGKKSIAQSIPIISVENPQARITHEASVGKINQKELETLMTRGLSERQAIDFIIRGVIK